MSEVSIIIPTFGDLEVWGPLALRAVASAEAQTIGAEIIHVHGRTLAEARNEGATKASGGYLVMLDADDELDAGYVEAMLKGSADLRQPATVGIYPDGTQEGEPNVIAPGPNLLERNHIVIGAMVRKELFHEVGGFDEFDQFEDWSLWLRCWIAGATIEAIPDAVYRVHFMSESRNRHVASSARTAMDIRERYRPLAQAKGLV